MENFPVFGHGVGRADFVQQIFSYDSFGRPSFTLVENGTAGEIQLS